MDNAGNLQDVQPSNQQMQKPPPQNNVQWQPTGQDDNDNRCDPGPTYLCDRCNESVKPIPDTLPDCKTHALAGLFFLCGMPFLIFLPYCFDCFGKPVSRCPQCGSFMKVPPPPPL